MHVQACERTSLSACDWKRPSFAACGPPPFSRVPFAAIPAREPGVDRVDPPRAEPPGRPIDIRPPRRAYAVKPLAEMPPLDRPPPPRPHIIHLRSTYHITNLGTLLDVLV